VYKTIPEKIVIRALALCLSAIEWFNSQTCRFAQKEELGDGNVQISPPGFHVMYLPFSEDNRKLHHEPASKGLLWPLQWCVSDNHYIVTICSFY
jgi:hypothetical protein